MRRAIAQQTKRRQVTIELSPAFHAALRRVVQRSPYANMAEWLRAVIVMADVPMGHGGHAARRGGAPLSGVRT